jgi:hypothetical protein
VIVWKGLSCGTGIQSSTFFVPVGISLTIALYSNSKLRSRGVFTRTRISEVEGCSLTEVDGREVCADVLLTTIKIVPQSAARMRRDLFIMTSDSLSSGSRKQVPRRVVRRSLVRYS